MKTIIYYRKSTDRDDKQANSLEHQLGNCRQIAKSNSFEVVKEIGESRSAKTEFTRPGFNELIDFCKKKKVDYIIVDEAKRLTRNNIDGARIVDLFDKWYIKWIYSTGRVYSADQINDIFLLQLDFSLSKMDNAHRSKDIKDKMQSCVKNHKRFLGCAPFGYKNITIKKGHKDIVVDKQEAKVVQEIFQLRLENKSYKTIAGILEEKYKNKIKIPYTSNRMNTIVNNKFYYWIFKWSGQEILWSHETIISKEIYDKANWVGSWVHECNPIDTSRPRTYKKYPLKWLIKDDSGILLTSYTKKGIDYYGAQYRSDVKVCINSKTLFEKIWDYIKKEERTHQWFNSIDKDIILDLLKQDELNNGNESETLDIEIQKAQEKQWKLLDMKLDDKINEEMYISKNNQLEDLITDLKEQKSNIKNDDFEEKTSLLLELAGSFYWSYFNANDEKKTEIIKTLMLELFIDTKKELQIEESPIFKSSKMLNCVYGTPGRDRTHANPGPRPGALPLSYGCLVCLYCMKIWE